MTEPYPHQPLEYRYITPTETDISHLNVLAICHYVMGGLTALFSSFIIIDVIIGVLMATGQFPSSPSQGAPPPAFVGWIMAGVCALMVVMGWTLAGLMIYAGRCLHRQRSWVFCIVIAALSCLAFPLGTVLGIFTLIVLVRDSVKARFGQMQASA